MKKQCRMVHGCSADELEKAIRCSRRHGWQCPGVPEEEKREGYRELIDLDLVEVSLVAEPMQPKARVHAVE